MYVPLCKRSPADSKMKHAYVIKNSCVGFYEKLLKVLVFTPGCKKKIAKYNEQVSNTSQQSLVFDSHSAEV